MVNPALRDNRRGNQEWTIQKHWVHKTQDEDKQNKQKTQKTKKMSNTDPTVGEPLCSRRVSRFYKTLAVLLIKLVCYEYICIYILMTISHFTIWRLYSFMNLFSSWFTNCFSITWLINQSITRASFGPKIMFF